MVVFVDLDDEVEPPEISVVQHQTPRHWPRKGLNRSIPQASGNDVNLGRSCERPNPNQNTFTEALGCYPIISEVASQIDLNTLDNLSRTCRQARENLLQFRSQLIMKTLRCCNENVVPSGEHTLRYRARAANWYFVEEGGASIVGKVGSCARDMVSECRRCNEVVCRNCTIKPPAPIQLRHRHRRLCPTCIKAQLSSLMSPALSISATPPMPSDPNSFYRLICTCTTEGVWLCQPCGRGLRSADQTYDSIWRWRTRYGPALGGLGTGISEGIRSFECGRGPECLAARLVEEEIDCDAEDAREIDASAARESDATTSSGSSVSVSGGVDRMTGSAGSRPSSSASSSSLGPSYARHEIEGIGGVVKRKLVRMVKVGACVSEWEDEKEMGKYLVREAEGRTRSWCGWCWRVIPSAKDKGEQPRK